MTIQLDSTATVVIGIFVGAIMMTLTPWYLKLRAIQQKADEAGVEPVLPSFNTFYIVTGVLSVIIAGVLNLGLVQQILDANPTANTTTLFIVSLLASAGTNALLNLGVKTGAGTVVLVEKKEEGAPVKE